MRFVIKCYKQREDIDYVDTYALITRINSIRMILAIEALLNLKVTRRHWLCWYLFSYNENKFH